VSSHFSFHAERCFAAEADGEVPAAVFNILAGVAMLPPGGKPVETAFIDDSQLAARAGDGGRCRRHPAV